MNPDFSLTPYTEHEAEIALYHAWPDGLPIQGPVQRHLQSGLIAAYRAGLKIGLTAEGQRMTPFADWRMSGRAHGGIWNIETSAPLGAITDAEGQITNLPEIGTPLVIVIRFYCKQSNRWRVHQFHDAELADYDAADASEVMMSAYRFRAGWRETFSGDSAGTLPSLEPRMVGVIEWMHSGRRIPCWYYDADTDTWTENDENVSGSGEDTIRYVSIDWNEADLALSFLTPRSQVMAVGGHDRTTLQWIDARAIQINPSSGLMMEPGWTLQTAGCPEPITLPPSSRHWEHPIVRIRFLGRLYATLAHGIFAVPSMAETPPIAPFDFPIRLGLLTLLPQGGYITPP